MSGFGGGAFWGTRVMNVVRRTNSKGLLWKSVKYTPTRRANTKKRLRRIVQNEAVLKACSEAPPSTISATGLEGKATTAAS